MYISNLYMTIYICIMLLIVVFFITMMRTRQLALIHKIYFAASGTLAVWLLAMIGLRYTAPDQIDRLMLLDAITTLGGAFIPPFSLLFAICYTKEYDNYLPKRYWGLLAIPSLTMLMIFTNRYHHLYYKVFSLSSTEVQFGPYFFVHSAYTYICVALSIFIIIRFAIKTKMRLHILQAILFTIGSLFPSLVNLLVVTNMIQATIALTPISFSVTLLFHGIIIYRLHFFDIKPIAMQQLINWIGDGYIVTNQSGLVVSYNRPFSELFGEQYHIRENIHLQECFQDEDAENKTAFYNLLTAIRSCQESHTKVTYEQAMMVYKNQEYVKSFYMVEVTPLIIKDNICGFLSILRDITQVKKNMQRLQDSQVKMMEQERLAFLGQMVGGLAHNLKTPIMSISGSVSAVENLVQECTISMDDPEVTSEDYREIYNEMDGWLLRIREACSYMSDIISAVKGQAGNMNVSSKKDFSLAEAFKRVSLLLRHELLNNQCTLKIEGPLQSENILIHGDINNLVQVINNLVSNAIDAQLPNGNHDIIVHLDKDDQCLKITITDFGSGISDKVRQKLFQEMVTSKGTLGTGLGVFISNTVIRAKFDGKMWFEDNPEGGTIWGISIPFDNVT
ncbi:MAG: histidine kinase N-terminal 7TM domain-containing protein, partial [Clostridiales bacterium]|nr:histidine kinase N-terminal 7TM domain-containing protein [Clostridiales bacterium]